MGYAFYKKNFLLLRAGIAVAVAVVLKIVMHELRWEILSLNPLFTGIVAANVFLMGFLLSGVLSDFKESERLPGELASILETLVDESLSIYERSDNKVAMTFAARIVDLGRTFQAWFFKTVDTRTVMDRLAELHRSFLALEAGTEPNLIVRMKQEHQALRRILIRMETIRETSFISSGYRIADVSTFLLTVGLLLSSIDPFYESPFLLGVIVFLLTFLIMLIRDLDNPFAHHESSSAEDVSLKPLEDFIHRMQSLADVARVDGDDPVPGSHSSGSTRALGRRCLRRNRRRAATAESPNSRASVCLSGLGALDRHAGGTAIDSGCVAKANKNTMRSWILIHDCRGRSEYAEGRSGASGD